MHFVSPTNCFPYLYMLSCSAANMPASVCMIAIFNSDSCAANCAMAELCDAEQQASVNRSDAPLLHLQSSVLPELQHGLRLLPLPLGGSDAEERE